MFLTMCAVAPLHSQTVEFGGHPVPYRIQGRNVIVHGDIIAGSVDEMVGGGKSNQRQSSRQRQAGATLGAPWPKVGNIATVPYADRSGVPAVATAIAAFNRQLAGVAQWVVRTTEADYVDIVDEGGCNSFVGRRGGAQTFSVFGSCGVQGILHEMGHTMGLLHQMQQRDRDRFLTMDFANIAKEIQDQYDISTQANDQAVGPFVYRSVMYYAPGGSSRTAGLVFDSNPPGIILDAPSDEYGEGDVEAIRRLAGGAATQVTVSSHPPGLRLRVDGQDVTAPQTYNWGLGTKHTIEAPEAAQKLGASMHVFGNWSDLGARAHEITVTPGTGGYTDPASSPAVTLYTANFVRYSKVEIVKLEGTRYGPGSAGVTSPGTDFPGEGTLYRERSLVTIAATPGAGGAFYYWNGGGSYYLPPPNYENPATLSAKGPIFLEALISPDPVTTITTNPPGLRVKVGASTRVGPTSYTDGEDNGWTAGSTHEVSIPDGAQVPRGVNTGMRRFLFDSWSDGGAATHTITAADAGVKVVTANFRTEHRLAVASPGCGGGVAITPASDDGFYRAGTAVTVTAAPAMGYFFTGWTGWPELGANAAASATVRDEQIFTATFNTVAQPLRIQSISPAKMSVSPNGGRLVLTGTGFTPQSTALFAKDATPTFQTVRFISDAQLEVTLTGDDLAEPGQRTIRVRNESCATESNVFFFQVERGTTPGTATFVRSDTTSSGTWKGVYGADGYYVIGEPAKLPAYVTVTPSANAAITWVASTSEARATQKPDANDRIAACWYSGTTFNIDFDFKGANSHQVALYLLDWDGGGQRAQKIDIVDAAGTVLDTRMATGYTNGHYLVWNLSGRVTARITNSGVSNAVVSGIFFGAGGAAPPTAKPSRLGPGGVLTPGQSLESPNGDYRLTYQGDGNLVLYRVEGAIPRWASGTFTPGPGSVVMQTDGNLVIYGPNGAQWASGTNHAANMNAEFVLKDDGVMAIVDTGRNEVWKSTTIAIPPTGATRDRLNPDEALMPGESLYSPSRAFRLIYQIDGNLVIYYVADGAVLPVWTSRTFNRPAGRVIMQRDGNFVIYPSTGAAHWATGTNSMENQGSVLVMQDDNNLVIYNQAGKPTWASRDHP
ncbi:MAG: M12 family metallopeptidase [Bryobacteraceae bacterium]